MLLAAEFDADGYVSAERPRVVAPDLASRFHGYLAHAPEVAPGWHTDGAWVWPVSLAHQVLEHAALPQRQLTEHIRQRWLMLPDRLDDEVLGRALAALGQEPVPDPPPARPWTYYRWLGQEPLSGGDNLTAQYVDEAGQILFRGFDPRSGWSTIHVYPPADPSVAEPSRYGAISAAEAATLVDSFAAGEQAVMLEQFRESMPAADGGLRLARVFDQGAGFSPDRLRIPETERRQRLARCLVGGSLVLRASGGFPDPLGGGELSLTFRTDGVWVWQEALADIVRRHGIAPELELLCHLERRALTPPEPVDAEAVAAARAVLERVPPPRPEHHASFDTFDPELPQRAEIEPLLLRSGGAEFSLLGDLRWHPSREDEGWGKDLIDVADTITAAAAARLIDDRLATGAVKPPILHWLPSPA